MADLRDSSAKKFKSSGTIEHINAGSLQRIADATETMAQNFVSLQKERDMLSRLSREKSARIAQLKRSNAALRGVITKLKRAAR